MDLYSVYEYLLDVFPHVDSRILKAVAIEHSKDADAAVEFVVSEILPSPSFSWASLSTSSSSTQNDNSSSYSTSRSPLSPVINQDVQQSTGEEGHSYAGLVSDETKQSIYPNLQWVDELTNEVSPLNPSSIKSKDANENDLTTTCLDELISASAAANIQQNDVFEELYARVEAGKWKSSEEWKSAARNLDISVSVGSESASSSTIIHEEASDTGCTDNAPRSRIQDFIEQVDYDYYLSVHNDFLQEQSCLNNSELEPESRIATFLPDSSAVAQEMLDFAECVSKKESDSFTGGFEKPGSSSSLDYVSEQVVCDSEIVDVEDNSPSATIITPSGQICGIDLFEDAIEDAKNNKQTLFLAMETVINMMKEVELQEKAAEEAKEEASRGGQDILARVEDLRQMLHHAKGANDMQLEEIYGEKAILATEMRELQTRLISLSDDREKSLTVLDEISRTLEARLAAAEEMRKSAEKEKDEKEDFARRALAEQEVIMVKVVQESKQLQLEAEENSKLRGFLMDRGQLVDILQGEIAVICKDVKLLKEKFDERVPISKSLYSSQTSCVLAVSASSAICIGSDWISEERESAIKSIKSDCVADTGRSSETPESVSAASSVHDHPQNNTFEDKGIIGDDSKDLLDNEWYMLDAVEAVET